METLKEQYCFFTSRSLFGLPVWGWYVIAIFAVALLTIASAVFGVFATVAVIAGHVFGRRSYKERRKGESS